MGALLLALIILMVIVRLSSLSIKMINKPHHHTTTAIQLDFYVKIPLQSLGSS